MELQRRQPSHSNFPLVPALPPTRIASGFCLCVSKTEIIIVFSLWGWIYLMSLSHLFQDSALSAVSLNPRTPHGACAQPPCPSPQASLPLPASGPLLMLFFLPQHSLSRYLKGWFFLFFKSLLKFCFLCKASSDCFV